MIFCSWQYLNLNIIYAIQIAGKVNLYSVNINHATYLLPYNIFSLAQNETKKLSCVA